MSILKDSSKDSRVTDWVWHQVREIHNFAWEEHRLQPDRATALAAEAYLLIADSSDRGNGQGEAPALGATSEISHGIASDLLAENYAIQSVVAVRAHEYGHSGFLEVAERLAVEAKANLTDSAPPLVRARVRFVEASILRNQFDYAGSEAMFHSVLSLLLPNIEASSEAPIEILTEPLFRLRIDTLNSLGRLQIFQGAFRQARETELQTLDLTHHATAAGREYPYGEASALKNLAVIYQRLGDFVEATAALHRSLEINETIGDYFGKTSGFTGLANISMLIDEPAAALNYLNSALQLARDHNNVAAEAIALGNLGSVYHMLGEMDLAIEHFETAVSFQRKINFLRGEAANLYGLGGALGAQGRLVEARREIQRALAIHRKLGDQHGIATCLISLGRLSTRSGAADAANHASADGSSFRKYLDEALEVIAPTGSQDLLADVHEAFSEGYKAIGDFSSALNHFEQFHIYKGKMSEAHAANRTQTLLFKRELEQNRKDSEVQRQHALELQAALNDAQEQRDRAERLANEDILTGMPNRRYGDQLLASALESARAEDKSVSLVFADADHFKSINDLYSHSTGDLVLRQLADICNQNRGPTDIGVRYGGEELLFILPGAGPQEARQWAERLRVLVEQYDWTAMHPDLSVTLSLGVAGWSSGDSPFLIDTLLSAADARLYEAKRAGRNCVRP